MIYKSILIVLMACVCLVAETIAQKNPKRKYTPEAVDYFLEVALGSEYGKNDKLIAKWQGDINLFVTGADIPPVRQELNRIIQELNALMKNNQIKEVGQAGKANLILFLGTRAEYVDKYESRAARYNDLGFFYVYPDENKNIQKGSLYIDTDRMQANDTRFHFLREELTQCLGLMNDSEKYPESIFYQKWSLNNEFTALDRQLIEMLYLPQIKAGMNAEQVRKVLESVER